MHMLYMFRDEPYVIFLLTVSLEKENVEVPGALLLDVRMSPPSPPTLHHPSTAKWNVSHFCFNASLTKS